MAKRAALPPTIQIKRNTQHDYITLRLTLDALAANLTYSRYGIKMSCKPVPGAPSDDTMRQIIEMASSKRQQDKENGRLIDWINQVQARIELCSSFDEIPAALADLT